MLEKIINAYNKHMKIIPAVEHLRGGYPNMEKSLTSRADQDIPTTFPGSFLYFEKLEKGPWERG